LHQHVSDPGAQDLPGVSHDLKAVLGKPSTHGRAIGTGADHRRWLALHDRDACTGRQRRTVRGERPPDAGQRDRSQLRGSAWMIGSERLVCLDFSLDRLAAVEVADGQVVRWTVEPILAGSLRGGDPVDREQLAGELKAALARARIGAKKARIAISDDAAVVRVIDVPRIPKRHMAGAIRYLSEQETPFPQGRASLAWDIVERRQSTVRVYLAAAWRDVVHRLADVVRAAGLDPQVIEPRSLAIIRAIGQEQAIVLDAGEAVARLSYVSRTETP